MLHKLKEVSISMIPLIIIGIVLNVILILAPEAEPLATEVIIGFFIGTVLVIIGQVLFLVGIDSSIMTMGSMVGQSVIKIKNIVLILTFGLIFGFLCTIAEPDLQVLSGTVTNINSNINAITLLVIVALGVGVFIVISLIKTFFNIKIKYILFASYILVFILAAFCPPHFMPLSFDSGGVTTGPITVPFIMSLCIGIAAIKSESSSKDSFGMIGLASIGPIIAVMILGIIKNEPPGEFQELYTNNGFFDVLLTTVKEVSLGLAPIAVIFLLFQFLYLKLPGKKLASIFLGLLVTYIGLVAFLCGVSYGFSFASYEIGRIISGLDFSWILIPAGILIGVAIVYTEPAIRVLGMEVEKVTSGHISRKIILNSLAISIGIAVGLGVLKALFGINMWYFLIPCYLIAFILMFFSPEVFTSIAFDSGGVASGPMTATFVLPLIIGICQNSGNVILDFAFGTVGIVALMPVIILQVMGILYKLKEKQVSRLQAEEEIDLSDFEKIKAYIMSDFDFSGL
ncbi:MAG: DUF1538 domain-containing protein [Firmicutes bacterium]|nr:DUF1538 domain-containing protein [Bacillota bacterium]